MKKFFYRVKYGDTIISVSNTFSVPTLCLVKDNFLKSEIEAGDIMIIEKHENIYKVNATDTLDSVSKKLCVSPERLSFLNGGITYVFYGLILTY